MTRSLQIFAFATLLLWASASASENAVKTQSTVVCSTASGSTKVSPVPRTTTTSTFQTQTTFTVTSTAKSTTTVTSNSTVTSTVVDTVQLTSTLSQGAAGPTSTLTIFTTTSDTVTEVDTSTYHGTVSSMSTYGPAYTITTTQTVTLCSGSARKRGLDQAVRPRAGAAKAAFPTQVSCINHLTLVSQITTTTTLAAATATASTTTVYTTVVSTQVVVINPNVTTSTSTVFTTTTSTMQFTTSVISTLIFSTTGVQTSTSTVTSTTFISIPTSVNISAGAYNLDYTYSQYYTGSGYSQSDTSPANPYDTDWPPIQTALNASLSDCEAIMECANLTASDVSVYYSFDLHYVDSGNTPVWSCVQYFYSNTNASYFNVPSDNITMGYGYSYQDEAYS